MTLRAGHVTLREGHVILREGHVILREGHVTLRLAASFPSCVKSEHAQCESQPLQHTQTNVLHFGWLSATVVVRGDE